jgi:hypothetical protein
MCGGHGGGGGGHGHSHGGAQQQQPKSEIEQLTQQLKKVVLTLEEAKKSERPDKDERVEELEETRVFLHAALCSYRCRL